MSERGEVVGTPDNKGTSWRLSPWSRTVLPLCLAVYLALAVAWAFILPLGQAPDEPAHFRYAIFIAENGRLPDFHADNAGYESYQAPLYYTLCAAVGKLTMIAGETTSAPPPEAL
jgi:hypothetical protein